MSKREKLRLSQLVQGDLLQLRCYDASRLEIGDNEGHLCGDIYDPERHDLFDAKRFDRCTALVPFIYLGPHDVKHSNTAARLLSPTHGVCWRYVCHALELAQPVSACEEDQ